ncbi:MAG: sigma-70 family RNA polymerase sigma factor [Candidatus Hydrogenedentota bacterium]
MQTIAVREDQRDAMPAMIDTIDTKARPGGPLHLSAPDIIDFRAGNTEIFERIFRTMWPIGFRAARRILLDRADAEEAAQEGFVRSWNARRSFKGESPDGLAAWIVTIIRRVALDVLRRRKPTSIFETAIAPDDPTRTVETNETRDAVHRALGALDPADRAAIILFEIEDLPQAEAAELMRLTIGAYKVRLHRARRRFREVYARLAQGCEFTRKGGESDV